jgi:glycerate-2-kinase
MPEETFMHVPRDAALAERLFLCGLAAVDPDRAVRRNLDSVRDALASGDYDELVVIGFGKAAFTMARAVHEELGDQVTRGVVVTKDDHAEGQERLGPLIVREASHPVPDARGVEAAREITAQLDTAGKRSLVLCLISGGGSALLCAPAEGITLEEKQATTNLLLRGGATIGELNAVRKHLSSVKGGRLAERAFPARLVSLIVSDVIDDPLDVIASGPCTPDPTTFADALAALDAHDLRERVPSSVRRLLERGAAGEVDDTPSRSGPVFEDVENRIVARNRDAVEAVADAARGEGFHVVELGCDLSGEARDLAQKLVNRAQETRERPLCLVGGGEATVTVRGQGLGGRNTELALAGAMALEGTEGITLLSGGTDGTDGPTDAAGAIVDGGTISSATAAGHDAKAALDDNDSYTFFSKTGGLLKTGPTGTNVMDLIVVLAR